MRAVFSIFDFSGFVTDACDESGSLAAHVDGSAVASLSFAVTDACDESGSLAAHVDGSAVASLSFAVTSDCEDSTMIYPSSYSSLWNTFLFAKASAVATFCLTHGKEGEN